jgi:(5-formylfuran-3-yl)methyl phosphate transaminase
LIEKAGVGVAPGVDFGHASRRAVRFSYASSEENIREAARRLEALLKSRNSPHLDTHLKRKIAL